MSSLIKCPVCNSSLRAVTLAHINSKKHQDALSKAGIDPSEDPALEMIKQPSEAIEEIVEEVEAPQEKMVEEELNDDSKSVEPSEEKENLIQEEEETASELNYATKEDIDLAVPEVPAPPKKKAIEPPTKELPKISIGVFDKMKEFNSGTVKIVFAQCDRCNAVISIPVPKHLVLNSELPLVPISYVHKNKDGEDLHCITIYLDHDFDIRRDILSDVILS